MTKIPKLSKENVNPTKKLPSESVNFEKETNLTELARNIISSQDYSEEDEEDEKLVVNTQTDQIRL